MTVIIKMNDNTQVAIWDGYPMDKHECLGNKNSRDQMVLNFEVPDHLIGKELTIRMRRENVMTYEDKLVLRETILFWI